MPVTENTPNRPARIGRSLSLAEVLGCDPDGAPKRPNLFGDCTGPSLPWEERNDWLRRIRRLIAHCHSQHENFPSKTESVARAIAELGDVCKAGLDYISGKAGCSVSTVKAVITWLESKGALTWSHTSNRDKSGRIVRRANLYMLIMDFAGAFAAIVRTRRSLWRERPKDVTVSKHRNWPGLLPIVSYKEQHEAKDRLAKVAADRTATLNAHWQLRYST